MSKAFVSEDSAVDEGPLLPPRPSEPLPITPAGHRQLLEERARMTVGDESTRTRSLMLDRILATVTVTAPALLDGGAGFGCEVVIEDGEGSRRTYALVGPDEIDAAAGRISAESPLGGRLLRARAGDVVELERAGRVDELEIIEVRVPAP